MNSAYKASTLMPYVEVLGGCLTIGLVSALFYWLQRKRHKKLNKALKSARNDDGDETFWLKTPVGLFVKPIVGLYEDQLQENLSKISGYFLRNESYHFILGTSWVMKALGFRYVLHTNLSTVKAALPKKKKKEGSVHFYPGKLLNGHPLKLSMPALSLILGAPNSGKSKLAYSAIEQLSTQDVEITVIDMTRSFPKRIAQRAGAVRLTNLAEIATFIATLAKTNEYRQALLNDYDLDHASYLPSDLKVRPIVVYIDEAHIMFSREQDFKSEEGRLLKSISESINSIVITGRKSMISFVYLSQSALKSETLINIGRATTIVSGYLSISESEAIGLGRSANNPGLLKGVFIVRSPETGPVNQIVRAYHREDLDLKIPLIKQTDAGGGGTSEAAEGERS